MMPRDAKLVADLVTGLKSGVQVADELGVCPQRVTQIKQRIYRKLQLRDDAPASEVLLRLRAIVRPDVERLDERTPAGHYYEVEREKRRW